MGRILRSRQSEQDYFDIWAWIAREGGDLDAADRMLRRFDRALSLLSDFYYPIEGGIELSRVLHASREVRRHFGRDDE